VSPKPGLNLGVWRTELADDADREFLLSGLENGFDIVDSEVQVVPVEVENHPSARPGSLNYPAIKQQVLQEISEGNYVVCDSKPDFISPLGAIPKSTGAIRLIHDCSRPLGNSLNDYATLEFSQRFQTIDDATSLVQPGYYMAKVDLKSAYRSVSISEKSQQFTGLKFVLNGQVVYLRDTKLPFGSKLAPGIFHRLTQAVKRMMVRRGFTAVVVYLDDFFICAPTLNDCMVAMNTLVVLLRHLGFSINWDKVIDPTRCLTFLGIEIDTASMIKRLPADKLLALKVDLEVFAKRKRASKRQLQSLAGKLHWAAGVVYGGRVFVRRILDAICTLRAANHKCVLTLEMRRDIQWWKDFMRSFNGMTLIIDRGPEVIVFTDACDVGAGGYCEGDYFYCNWAVDWPETQDSHINVKELAAVVLAAQRWGPLWANKHVLVLSDNSTTVAGINRGSSRSVLLMKYLRHIFWLSAMFNFRLKAVHVPGEDNVLADRISRLHEPNARQYLNVLLALSPLSWHMSYNGFLYILDRSWVPGLAR